jgi:hypothetical protein
MLRIPHCLDNRLTDVCKVFSHTHRPHFTPQKHYYFYVSAIHSCLRLSKPQGLVLPEWLDMEIFRCVTLKLWRSWVDLYGSGRGAVSGPGKREGAILIGWATVCSWRKIQLHGVRLRAILLQSEWMFSSQPISFMFRTHFDIVDEGIKFFRNISRVLLD